MSQQEEAPLPPPLVEDALKQKEHDSRRDSKQSETTSERVSSDTDSDDDDDVTENDDFEDAVDASPVEENAPVRSLTKRTVSAAKAQGLSGEQSMDEQSVPTNSNGTDGHEDDESDDDTDQSSVESDDENDTKEDTANRRKSAIAHRISNTSNLDNVDLSDADETPPSPPAKDTKQPQKLTKTISLSSITGSLPAMPWSPSTEPAKTPSPPTTTMAPPPPPASQPAPTRKLTSPFSWLSRTSSKDKEQTLPPAGPTYRRNTASSIATLTSNPEMMLSKLEEEADGEVEMHRISLLDRFKQVRLQQEGHVADGENVSTSGGESNATGLGITTVEQRQLGDKPPSSPVPEPISTLAPGTVSGVNTGLSAISDTKVDWDLWQAVINEGPAAVARSSAEELNKAIATGIPSAIRGVIWQVLASSKNDELELVYKDLSMRGTDKSKDRHSSGTTTSSFSNGNLSVQSGEAVASSASSVKSGDSGSNSVSDKTSDVQKAQAAAALEKKKKEKEDTLNIQRLEKVIRRDIGARTSYSKYAAAAGLQEGLLGVCKAYALFDEGVGYAQGMNFLIMPLLFNMPEQEAFCLLVRLMNHYKLRDLFVQDMPGLHMHLYQFERLLEDFEPALYCHLHRKNISPHLYATPWFLTLFSYRFPLQLVLRIYDLIFSDGLSAILRFGLVLMQKNASTLLGLSDMQELTTYLKDRLFDVYIDKDPSHGSILENGFFGSSTSSMDKEVYRADQLVKDASEVKITTEMLKEYTVEWEEKTKAEKDRENELQELRLANQNATVRIRKLEERVEACDQEQADFANELVRTKVENEELRDENESMKGQVRELRIVIEKQPEDIEGAWKLERDDLIKRNLRVHEENQKLEKEMAELEEALVSTKLRYAEINSQHEELNRKWIDLKRHIA
ncbi:rab-GTPase-TBC domain-containing protein [Mariannaea sp. PMI_226]|nr:rab-GTPase-TBC domain-containing protein [Mariannaea sp. PMI_226]